jgi:hypothetical protein
MRRSGHCLLAIVLSGWNFEASAADASAAKSPSATASPNTAALPSGEEIAVQVVEQGTSTKAAREQARQAFPLGQLNAEQQRLANSVLGDISLFRRLPTVKCPVDSRVYQFFIEHPEVAVQVWKVLGISRLELRRTSPTTFFADTGDGSTGNIHLLLKTPTQCVVYCDGMFKSPVLARPIKARTIVVLNSTFQTQTDGLQSVTHSVDMFVSFPSLAVETIARLVSPLSYKYADRNMEEISSFLRMMDLSMSRQPGWVEQVVILMEGLQPECRDRLLKLTAEVYVEAQRKARTAGGEALSIEAIRPPVQTASGADAPAVK